jgi:hypothetical protein
MDRAALAQAFPYIYWMLLVGLGVGAFAFVAITGRSSDATRGYLRFTAACAASLAGLGLLADLSLTVAPALVIRLPPADLELLRRAALATFAGLAITSVVVGGNPVRLRRQAVALATLVAGGLTLAAAAFGWAPSAPDGVPLLLQLMLLSLASGGALAALVLGHWYLVTPRVSERPLLLQARVLAGVLVLQLAVFATWALFGGGPRQAAFESLTGGAALFGWLRLVVSLVFPLVLVTMAWATARTRSMESATGLLYIAVAAIFAGTIGAATLYLAEGVLV